MRSAAPSGVEQRGDRSAGDVLNGAGTAEPGGVATVADHACVWPGACGVAAHFRLGALLLAAALRPPSRPGRACAGSTATHGGRYISANELGVGMALQGCAFHPAEGCRFVLLDAAAHAIERASLYCASASPVLAASSATSLLDRIVPAQGRVGRRSCGRVLCQAGLCTDQRGERKARAQIPGGVPTRCHTWSGLDTGILEEGCRQMPPHRR